MKKLPQTSHDNHESTSIHGVPDHDSFNDIPPSAERESVHKSDSLRRVSAASQKFTSERIIESSGSSRCGKVCPEMISGRYVSSTEHCDLASKPSYSVFSYFNSDKKLLQGKGSTQTDSTVSFGNKLHLPKPSSYKVPCTISQDECSKSEELVHSSVSPRVQLGACTSVHQLLRHSNAYSNRSEISSSLTVISKGDLNYLMEYSGAPLKSQTLAAYFQESKPLNRPRSGQELDSSAPSTSSAPGTHRSVIRRSPGQDVPIQEVSSSSVSSLPVPLTSGEQLLSAVASVHHIRGPRQRSRPLRSRPPKTENALEELPGTDDSGRQPQAHVQHRREQKKTQSQHPTQPQRQKNEPQTISESPAQREHKRKRKSEGSAAQNEEIRQQRRLPEKTSNEQVILEGKIPKTTENEASIKRRPRHKNQHLNKQYGVMQIEPNNQPQRKTMSGSQTQLTSETQVAPPTTKRAKQPKKHLSQRQGESQVEPLNNPQIDLDRLEFQSQLSTETEESIQIPKHDNQRKKRHNQRPGEMRVESFYQPQSKVRLESQPQLPGETQVAPQTKKPDNQRKKHHRQRPGEMQLESVNQPQIDIDRIEFQLQLPSQTQETSQTTKRDKQRRKHESQRRGVLQVESLNQPQIEVDRLDFQTHNDLLESETQLPSDTQTKPQTTKHDNQRKRRHRQRPAEMQVEPFNQQQIDFDSLESPMQSPSETLVAPHTTKLDNQRKKRQRKQPVEMQIDPLNQSQSEVQLVPQTQLSSETQVAPQTTKHDKQRKRHHRQRPGEMQVEPLNQPQNEVQLEPQAELPRETHIAPQTRQENETPVEPQIQFLNRSEGSLSRRSLQVVSSQFGAIVPAIRNDGPIVSRSPVHSTTRLPLASAPTSTRRFDLSREQSLGSGDHAFTPEVYNDFADPWEYAKLLTKWEAWVHVIKGILGAGMLFLPFCFAHSGIIAGIGIVLGSSVICYAGHYVLMWRTHEFRLQEREEMVGYAGVVKVAFMRGPWKFPQTASCFECFIYVLVVLYGILLGYVYVVIVSSIIGDILQKYWMDLSFAQSTLFSLGLIIPLNLIPTLKILSTYVLLSNIILLTGIIILIYYFLENPVPNSSAIKVAGNLQGITVLFSCALFASQAVPLIVSVQTCMLDNESLINRLQILEFVTIVVTSLFISLGVLGYQKFGGEVKAIVLFNLPQVPLAYYCKATFALSLCFSHPLIIYPVYEFVWEKYFKKTFISLNLTNVYMENIILRVTLTLLTIVPAFFIISAAKYCLIFVTMIATVLIIIFPALIEICIRWDRRQEETTSWALRVILFFEVLLVLLGLYIFVFGTFWSVDVIRKLQHRECT